MVNFISSLSGNVLCAAAIDPVEQDDTPKSNRFRPPQGSNPSYITMTDGRSRSRHNEAQENRRSTCLLFTLSVWLVVVQTEQSSRTTNPKRATTVQHQGICCRALLCL